MSARKEFGGVITFIVHPDFIRDNRFYPVIPKTIQMVINEAATRPEKLYFIDQDTSAPVKNTDKRDARHGCLGLYRWQKSRQLSGHD